MPRILHYRNKCIGCGICHQQQPELWRMSRKDGKATLLKAINKKEIYQLEIPVFVAEATNSIAASCPVKVIKVVQ